MQKIKRLFSVLAATALAGTSALTLAGCAGGGDKTVTLRVCSWEEYIDLGGWEQDEVIELEKDDGETVTIFGENSMVDDFTEWFNSDESGFDFDVRVEYSTFGTNEDLYNRLSLGDVYDLVCPSDYMIMKLIAEDKVENFSDDFFDKNNANNFYVNNVSPYIDGVFTDYDWNKLAACYMWGTTGIVYNPDKVDAEDVSTWEILRNSKYKRQVTIKDNVRDAYFATLGIINSDELKGGVDDARRSELLNDVKSETIAQAEDVLKQIKDNVYSFETDAGKADMVTGKVFANYQWSGDAVYIMDEAEDDGTELWYSVPDECTNLWFDGWLMLKDGIAGDDNRQIAAEAFVNFLSKPENAVRNMYYIGYTSAIAGETVYDYMDWNYGAETDDTVDYDLTYFFDPEDTEGNFVLSVDAENFGFEDDDLLKTSPNRGRQLFAQYPPANVMARSVVMVDFGDKLAEINQMWINVRCLDLKDISPVTVGIVAGVVGAVAIGICLYAFRYKIFIKHRPKKGYHKVEE